MNPVSDDYILQVAWRRWGITPKKVAHSEWASPCPQCGGRDRFRIFQNDGGWWCRDGDGHCGQRGWLDDDQKNFKPNPDFQKQQAEREKRMLQERADTVAEWQSSYRAEYYKGWHEHLPEHARQRLHERGMTDELIAKHMLGYCAQKHVRYEDENNEPQTIVVGAFTIPIFSPYDGKIVNVHYRLDISHEQEKLVGGKYRSETLKDQRLPAAAWHALPHGVSKHVIIVEGAFKAIVVAETVGPNIQVIGLPSNVPHPDLLEDIGKNYAGTKYIWLDPGAEKAAERIASILKCNKTRILILSWKSDDAILYHSIGLESVRAWLNQSTPIYAVSH